MPPMFEMPDPPVMPEPIEVPSSDGVRLAAYDPSTASGPGAATDRTDVLLAHANGFCAAVFAPLVESLGAHRCISYDARAHGRSSRGSADMAWEGHRDDVLAVHDSFALRRPVGVGHSMGGAALLLAEQLRPGTFAALWLYEPIVFPGEFTGVDENPLERKALRRRRRFASRQDAFANFAAKPPLSELSARCLAAYVTYGFRAVDDCDEPGGIVLACTPEDEAAGYRMGPRHGAWDHLGEVRCPVVVLRGRDDATGPAAIATAIAAAMPAARLEGHDDLGHFGPLADPVAMARSVEDLIGSALG